MPTGSFAESTLICACVFGPTQNAVGARNGAARTKIRNALPTAVQATTTYPQLHGIRVVVGPGPFSSSGIFESEEAKKPDSRSLKLVPGRPKRERRLPRAAHDCRAGLAIRGETTQITQSTGNLSNPSRVAICRARESNSDQRNFRLVRRRAPHGGSVRWRQLMAS